MKYLFWLGFGLVIAALNGFLCWLNYETGKPIFAAMSGASCALGLWTSRALFEICYLRIRRAFLLRRTAKRLKALEAELQWRMDLEEAALRHQHEERERARNEGKK